MKVEYNGYSIAFSGSTLEVSDTWNYCSMGVDAETCRQLVKVEAGSANPAA